MPGGLEDGLPGLACLAWLAWLAGLACLAWLAWLAGLLSWPAGLEDGCNLTRTTLEVGGFRE